MKTKTFFGLMAFVCLVVLNFTEGANNFGLGQALASTSSDSSSSNSSWRAPWLNSTSSNATGATGLKKVFIQKIIECTKGGENTTGNQNTNSNNDTHTEKSKAEVDVQGHKIEGGTENSRSSGTTHTGTSGSSDSWSSKISLDCVVRECHRVYLYNEDCTEFMPECGNRYPEDYIFEN